MKRFNIPIIDFHQFLKGSALEKQGIANQVLDGFRNVGFIYLANHGIPNYTVDDVFKQSRSFFQRPEIEKQALAWETPESNRGYVRPGREKVTQLTSKEQVEALKNNSPDIKESFEIGKESSTKFKNRWYFLLTKAT
jgi:isopenicillin N synthase-like dioxygenase